MKVRVRLFCCSSDHSVTELWCRTRPIGPIGERERRESVYVCACVCPVALPERHISLVWVRHWLRPPTPNRLTRTPFCRVRSVSIRTPFCRVRSVSIRTPFCRVRSVSIRTPPTPSHIRCGCRTDRVCCYSKRLLSVLSDVDYLLEMRRFSCFDIRQFTSTSRVARFTRRLTRYTVGIDRGSQYT